MTAAVEIIVRGADEALQIPNRRVEGASFIYRVDQDGYLELIKITIGASSNQYSQVTAGNLSPGDVIVLNPYEL